MANAEERRLLKKLADGQVVIVRVENVAAAYGADERRSCDAILGVKK